jgi:hypothetical protein
MAFTSVDEMILSNPDQERQASRALEERRRSAEEEDLNEESDEEEDSPGAYRRQLAAKRSKLSGKIDKQVFSPIRIATSAALRTSWLFLLPSFTLSFLYMPVHAFCKMVFGKKMFCDWGEEWIPRAAKSIGGGAAGMAEKSIGLAERIVFYHLLAFYLVISFLIYLIVSFIVNIFTASIMDKIGHAWDVFWTAGFSGLKALFDLLF